MSGSLSTGVSPLGIQLYRAFARGVQKCTLPFVVSNDRLAKTPEIFEVPEARLRYAEPNRVWFHAASVGELESLWPLIEMASLEGDTSVILTVFSSSAYEHVLRTMKRLPQGRVIFAGYSPFEGDWLRAIRKLKPSLFVTAKYEAWPELWSALATQSVPLAIVGAKLRSSLKLAKAVLRLLGGDTPEMTLFTFRASNAPALQAAFPAATIEKVSDPRWDRVLARASLKQDRVQALLDRHGALPRPWAVVGSAWGSDLAELLKNRVLEWAGTPIIVPHKTDPRSVKELEILVRDLGFSPIRTTDGSGVNPAGRIALIVDEMGFLAELYGQADWAFVGGGFGAGVHSTIEPAIFGVPIFSGPAGSEKFDEIAILEEQGQLQLLKQAPDWARLREAAAGKLAPWHERKSEWVRLAREHQGTSRTIWQKLLLVRRTEVARSERI